MTAEKIRELIKVHIQAAESLGKFAVTLALLEILDAIDAETAIDNSIHNTTQWTQ